MEGGKIKMEANNWLAALVIILLLGVGIFIGAVGFSTEKEVDKIIIQEKLIEKECPVIVCQEVVIPEIQNADNALLNEFLEDNFEVEYNAIKDLALIYAEDELEDHDDEVVVDYLESLIEGFDEDSIHVSIEETDIEVTALGLKEDEDKSARVTFELEVDYDVRVESENGYTMEEYSKDIVVIYDVVFEEGILDELHEDFDEEVELVSII